MTPVWQASIGEEAHLPSPASQNGTVKHYVECGPLSETAALGTGKQATFTAEGDGGVGDYGRGPQEVTRGDSA